MSKSTVLPVFVHNAALRATTSCRGGQKSWQKAFKREAPPDKNHEEEPQHEKLQLALAVGKGEQHHGPG